MNAPIIHMGTGKLRCRNELDGVRCPYRRDAHPEGGCPTRNAREERIAQRRVAGRYSLSLDGLEVTALADVLDMLEAGDVKSLTQIKRSDAFKRAAGVVVRTAKRARENKR